MTIQEANELVLSKVPEEKKEAFIAAITACRNKAEKLAVLKKFGIQLTEKELGEFGPAKIMDEDLDLVAGGCQYCVPPPSNCPKCGHTLGILFDDEDDYYWEVWCQSYDCDYETTSYEYYGF